MIWTVEHLVTGEVWTNRGEQHDPAHEHDALYKLAEHRYRLKDGSGLVYMDMDSIAFGVDRNTGTRLTAFLIDECGNTDELPFEYWVEVAF